MRSDVDTERMAGHAREAVLHCERPKKQAAGLSIRELEARRDSFLVELFLVELTALVQKYWREAEGRLGRL
jgi:hypothetical protein